MACNTRMDAGGRDFGDKSERMIRKGQRFPLGFVAVGAYGQDVSWGGACRRDDGLGPIMSGCGEGFGRRQYGSALGAKHKAGRAGVCARRSTVVRYLSAGVRRESFLLHYLYGICAQQGIGVRAVLGACGRNGDDRVIRGGQCGQGQQGGLALFRTGFGRSPTRSSCAEGVLFAATREGRLQVRHLKRIRCRKPNRSNTRGVRKRCMWTALRRNKQEHVPNFQ